MYYNGAFNYQDLPNVSSTYDIVNLYSLGEINSVTYKYRYTKRDFRPV